MKDFIYAHLPYLLLIVLALPVLLSQQEIALNLQRAIPHNPNVGIVIGLTNQRIVALLVLAWCAWRILRKRRR
ncbi:hypothetical protein L0Y47_23460 [Ectopseudomonas composti]|jgi:hypothetical protein|uniref:Uncharacterized protein n=1 Tax=Ectopseudomonas composti TaxID=658457 RepID=A0A1I5NK94_9GAMM|nr:hypothetical protein [Pseudomonas composti]EZH76714.1 hypothetical protein AU05_03205 [Pseudomonas composti]MDN5515599.1 hypothetical protein [Pseudomonas sp.]SFP22070.1 hypothetical protein SAMN05216601_1079 [Pseudomonas composti]